MCASLRNENGSVMNMALLVLLLITLIVIYLSQSSTLDVAITGNEKNYQTAFYVSDSGIYVAPKVISAVLEKDGVNSLPATAAVTFSNPAVYLATTVPTDDDGLNPAARELRFLEELYGFASSEDATKNGADPIRSPDITFPLAGQTVDVDILRIGQEILVGGGAEFGSGSAGIGSGSTGGVAVLYKLDSLGSGPKSSAVNIVATYRKIPGTAGGL